MIIVSQSKDFMINFDRTYAISLGESGEKYIVVAINEVGDVSIGEYSTQERAKEIFQEIIQAINNKSTVKIAEDMITTVVSSEIYEMPED